jgi:hypothetical protein
MFAGVSVGFFGGRGRRDDDDDEDYDDEDDHRGNDDDDDDDDDNDDDDDDDDDNDHDHDDERKRREAQELQRRYEERREIWEQERHYDTPERLRKKLIHLADDLGASTVTPVSPDREFGRLTTLVERIFSVAEKAEGRGEVSLSLSLSSFLLPHETCRPRDSHWRLICS